MATGNISNEKELYSLEETICGTWIDGSPIYRKTLILPNGNYNVNTTYDLTVNGVPSYTKIINSFFTIEDSGRANHPYSGAAVLVSARPNLIAVIFHNIGTSAILSNDKNYVTIEYLK